MTYDRREHLKELDETLRGLLHDIELDEKEIRRIQDRLRSNICVFRGTMSERDAVERAMWREEEENDAS